METANSARPLNIKAGMSLGEKLIPMTGQGWQRGFSNLLRKESRAWWQSKQWLVHLLIWLAVINGTTAFVAFALTIAPPEPGSPPITPQMVYQTVLTSIFQLGLVATSIGVVVTTQGAFVGEKQMGTAAWILSKPVSRSAFVLAKLLANAFSFVILAVLLPSLLGYLEVMLISGRAPELVSYVTGAGVWVLNVLFYIAFMIMLGTLFSSRGAVTGIALAFMFGGSIVTSVLPHIAVLSPWPLAHIAAIVGAGQPLPADAVIPMGLTVFWIVLCSAVALWRFGREEF